MTKNFQETVRHIEEYHFFHTTVQDARTVFPEAKAGEVFVLKDFDEEMVVFRDGFMEDSEKLKDFLLLHMFPIVTELSERALEKVLSENARRGVFLFRSANAPEAKRYDEEFRKVATAMRSKEFLFFQTDVKGALPKQIADTFGVDEASLPVLQAVELKEETMMYRHTGEINEQTIKDFIGKWLKDDLPRYYTSEPVPKTNPGPVFKVVGKTFKAEVINPEMDVLVKFYAPWCEFSKMIEPIYKKLAEAMKDNKRIKFCEIDATKNDIEGYPLEGYPTIKFFPAKDKTAAVAYQGDFTEDALRKFIEEKTNSEIELPEEPRTEDDDESNMTPKPDL